MEAITITSSEEFNGITTVFLSNGHNVRFATSELILFIEDNNLNVENQGSGLVCEPNGTDNEVEVCTADEYLDNNWDSVVSNYYKNNY